MEVLFGISIFSLAVTLLLKSTVLVSTLYAHFKCRKLVDTMRCHCKCVSNKVQPEGEGIERVSTSSPAQSLHHLVTPQTGFISTFLVIMAGLLMLIFLKTLDSPYYPRAMYMFLNFTVMPAISLLWVLKDDNLRKFALSVIFPCKV